MRLITANGLAVRHPGHVALHDVDFHIDRGEIVTIVGPNGSGKTTLLRALIGAIKPSEGTVERMVDSWSECKRDCPRLYRHRQYGAAARG